MLNLPVAFNTICELLSDFLTDRGLGFYEIEPCPFGQAYVRFSSVFDRDALVSNSPHLFTDVHVIFQMHNQGLNWRNLVLNRDVWILLYGYPFDRISIQEVSNAINKFGKFLMWDHVRSTRANHMIHVRVEELSDIPVSIVFGGRQVSVRLTYSTSVNPLAIDSWSSAS